MSPDNREVTLELIDGIQFYAGPETWFVESLKVHIGEWVALVPNGQDPVANPAGPLSWILATMEEPPKGTVDLMGHNIYGLEYATRQRLRSKIGFVHGYGGLLSNRTVAENVALPISIHAGLKRDEEQELVNKTLDAFALQKVSDLQPHEMDGSTRWRACLARALVLEPVWLVLEGLGNWEMDQGRGIGWTRLIERQQALPMASVICLARQNPGFENWFENNGGRILRYNRYEESN